MLKRVGFVIVVTLVVVFGVLVPLYLLAIYPDMPVAPSGPRRGWARHAMSNYWYRLTYCGLHLTLGSLLLFGILSRRPRK